MRVLIPFFAVMCLGCAARHAGVPEPIAHPAQIVVSGVYFDGGTTVLRFIGRNGECEDVYLPHGNPISESVVGEVVGRPFFIAGHGDTRLRQVQIDSPEEASILASLKQLDRQSKAWATAQEFLTAAQVERYLAARPKLLHRRSELAAALRSAAMSSATQPSPWDTDDLTERQKREEAAAAAESEWNDAAARWEEFCTLVEIMADENGE